MYRNCKNCFWSTYWGEAGIEYICERDYCCSFEECVAECLKEESCSRYITIEDGMRIAEGFDG